MKREIIVALLIITTLTIKAQDSFKWQSGVSVGFLPIIISGTQDVGAGNLTIVDNYAFETAPVYEHTETSGLMMNLVAHFGAKIPIITSKTWSTGVILNSGFGYQNGLSNTEGLSSFLIKFPNYVYYRNYSGNFDFSLQLGYQFTFTALNSHLIMGGFEYHINEDASLRLFSSLYRYKYYIEYTNGNIEPGIKIGELGIAYIYNF
jgi:hypothetical protein